MKVLQSFGIKKVITTMVSKKHTKNVRSVYKTSVNHRRKGI